LIPKSKLRRITEEDIIAWALEYSNKDIKLKTLASKSGRHQTTLCKKIREAFTKGLVRAVRVTKQDVRRDTTLEGELKRAFRIQQPVVVDVGTDTDVSEQALRSDHIHDELGRALALLISQGVLTFRNGDIVGLGSGRGVYYTVEALGRVELGAGKVTLVSLTGDVYARSHARSTNVRMDADLNTNQLGKLFSQELNLYLTSSSIYHPNEQSLNSKRDRSWLGTANWKPPHIALIGVGVLEKGHRFYDLALSSDQEPVMGELRAQLRDLVSLCDRVRRYCKSVDHYFPVADVCNNLFFVKPPKGLQIRGSDESEIADRINAINSCLFNVTAEQLKQIGHIILIAGTRQKALAIRHLLEGGEYNIGVLCTDSETAKTIISYQ
jgi:DNA-binding transcriptional regulator LsrR (DeoR family)